MAETKELYAIIHVGSSSMSIMIVEYSDMEHVKIIEQAKREVTFGEELFQTKKLSFKTIREMCRVLKGYRELMKTYGVTKYKAVATSVIREATNSRNIIDQIFVQAGFDIEVIEIPREFYMKFFALYRDRGIMGITEQDQGTLFLDVTSGGLSLAVWQYGKVVYQQNLHIGTIRVLESFNRLERDSHAFVKGIEEYMYSMLKPIVQDLERYSINYLVISGEENRRIAELMKIDPKQNNVIISPDLFKKFYDSFDGVTTTKLMERYNLPEHWANILMPLMTIYNEVLSLIPVKSLCINHTTFREGLMLYYGAELTRAPYIEDIRLQTIQLAKEIGSRYHYDSSHIELLSIFGRKIIDELRHIGGMSERSIFLYRIAAILHDIGRYVTLNNHNHMSYAMIMNLDLFGLSESEKRIVANVAYYNTGDTPSDRDRNFRKLTEIEKMAMVKLLAIFRMARALDQSHLQKIDTIEVSVEEGTLLISALTNEDISLERWTFENEVALFEDVFGLSVKLQQKRS